MASTRPTSAVAIDSRANTPFSQLAVTRPAATPARARLGKDIATPRTASELHNLWGRTLDSKFTEQTIAWLAKASKQVTSVRPFGTQYCCSTLTTSPGRAGEGRIQSRCCQTPSGAKHKGFEHGQAKISHSRRAHASTAKRSSVSAQLGRACGPESDRRRNTFPKKSPALTSRGCIQAPVCSV